MSGTGPIGPGGWCPHYGDICHVRECAYRATCVDAEKAWVAKQAETDDTTKEKRDA